MNNAVIKGLGVSLLVAILGYVLLSFTSTLPGPISFVAGALLSGLAVSLFVSNSSDNPEDTETTTLYVGNLPYRANESAVHELFAGYGYVRSVRLLKDRQTGKRRGFGFVEMAVSDAGKAIKSLNDQEFMQRTIKVREAKNQPKEGDE